MSGSAVTPLNIRSQRPAAADPASIGGRSGALGAGAVDARSGPGADSEFASRLNRKLQTRKARADTPDDSAPGAQDLQSSSAASAAVDQANAAHTRNSADKLDGEAQAEPQSSEQVDASESDHEGNQATKTQSTAKPSAGTMTSASSGARSTASRAMPHARAAAARPDDSQKTSGDTDVQVADSAAETGEALEPADASQQAARSQMNAAVGVTQTAPQTGTATREKGTQLEGVPDHAAGIDGAASADTSAGTPVPDFGAEATAAASPDKASSPFKLIFENPAQAGAAKLAGDGVGTSLAKDHSAVAQGGAASHTDSSASSLPALVSRGMSAVLAQRGGSLTLRLTPDTLGSLKIQMDVSQGVVSVRLETVTEQARQLLSQHLDTLRSALESKGLSVDKLGVHLSPGGPLEAAQGSAAGSAGLGSGAGSAHDQGGNHAGAGSQKGHEPGADAQGFDAGGERSRGWLGHGGRGQGHGGQTNTGGAGDAAAGGQVSPDEFASLAAGWSRVRLGVRAVG